MATVTIRPVRSIVELEQVYDLAGRQFDPPLSAHDGTRRCRELVEHFEDDSPLMLVAEEDSEPIGAALAFRTTPGTVTLRIIGVIPAARGAGIGRALVEAVEETAHELDVRRIDLGADDQADFYLHLGFSADLFLQWAYAPERYDEQVEELLRGPLMGLDAWRASYEGVPQLRVRLSRVDREFRNQVDALVDGAHVGFVMGKDLASV
ncbi:MAG: GNAT family N-acetyltransferase [Acidimicrobiia bacterium]